MVDSVCYQCVCVPDTHTLYLSDMYNGARVHTHEAELVQHTESRKQDVGREGPVARRVTYT